jgi:hypothetical protein
LRTTEHAERQILRGRVERVERVGFADRAVAQGWRLQLSYILRAICVVEKTE